MADERITRKIYSPLTADFWSEEADYDLDSAAALSGVDLMQYQVSITEVIQKRNEPGDGWDGNLMEYYDKDDGVARKATSLKISVEPHEGRLCGCATVTLTENLEPGELQSLFDYISGQYADGYGEGFEQQEIPVDGGCLNVHLWQSKHFTLTPEQDTRPAKKVAKPLPRPKMKLVGEDGNIYSILGRAAKLLRDCGQNAQAKEMQERVFQAKNYYEALGIVSQYVETEMSDPPAPHLPTKGGDAR